MALPPLQVVWFKRDLRLHDHAPLAAAAAAGPVLPLAMVEPELWAQPDASARQWEFCAESLNDLRHALALLGQPLVVRVGDPVQLLEMLHQCHGVAALWSHQETGNGFTYARDRRVRAWANRRGVRWIEHRQHGVVRGLGCRDGWARQWEDLMGAQAPPPPPRLPSLAGIEVGAIPTGRDLGLAADPCPHRQRGGRGRGQSLLDSFLNRRGRNYHQELSSPLTAADSCSRLSPHLAWGTLSLREVVQATRRRSAELRSSPDRQALRWCRALATFEQRLHWHCHFIQKLESQPSLEFRDLHPATAGLRRTDPARLAAWAEGRTGLPFVDACMRALRAGGWINFRMRAMLMSVASHHLWIDWRDSGLQLARLFVDYEPGIHWSQCQMQSGSTGINTIRVYNPLKQGLDHDPQGLFLRRWLPELRGAPLSGLHRPWTMDPTTQQAAGCLLPRDYPPPIIDVDQAARLARERLWALRRDPGFAEVAAELQERHGSRRSGLRSPRRRSSARRRGGRPPAGGVEQLSLDLD